MKAFLRTVVACASLLLVAMTGCSEDAVDDVVGTGNTGPALVHMVPSQSVYSVGESVVVEIHIDNARNVASVPFHLRFDPDVLTFVPPGSEGPFLRSDGALTVFLASDRIEGGELVVGLSRLGEPDGMSGDGLLATLEFQTDAAGDCGFAFTDAAVKDPEARTVPAAFESIPVRVDAP
jgi:hypothetical protein